MASLELNTEELRIYDKIIKEHQSSTRTYTCKLGLYFLDIILLILTGVIHAGNKNWTAFALSIAIHILSASLVAILYNHNQSAIDEGNSKFIANEKKWTTLRRFSQILCITPLFRIIVNWKDYGELRAAIRQRQRDRTVVDSKELNDAEGIRRKLLVDSYFDVIHVYFKTIPQILLQLYFMIQYNRPLRLCKGLDFVRFAGVPWGILSATLVSTQHVNQISQYLQLIHLKDRLDYNTHPILANSAKLVPWHANFAFCLFILTSIGLRIYLLGVAMELNILTGFWYVIAMTYSCHFLWLKVKPESRPIFENPPRGISTLTSELVDRFVTIFSPHTTSFAGCGASLVHAMIFTIVYISLLLVHYASKGMGIEYHRTNLSDPRLMNCNLSLFGITQHKIPRGLHILLNSEEFGALVRHYFNPTVKVVWSLSLLSPLLCCAFTSYRKCIGSAYACWKLQFPVSTAIKSWEKFLNIGNDMDTLKAMKIILLGVLPEDSLNTLHYKTQSELWLIAPITRVPDCITPTPEFAKRNPCDENLGNLIQFLQAEQSTLYSQNNAEKNSTDPMSLQIACLTYYIQAGKNFRLYFDFYMRAMSSHRLARTHLALNISDRKFWSVFYNVKHNALQFQCDNGCFLPFCQCNNSGCYRIGSVGYFKNRKQAI